MNMKCLVKLHYLVFQVFALLQKDPNPIFLSLAKGKIGISGCFAFPDCYEQLKIRL